MNVRHKKMLENRYQKILNNIFLFQIFTGGLMKPNKFICLGGLLKIKTALVE